MSAVKRTADETKIPIIAANEQANDLQISQDRVYTSDSYKNNGRSIYLNQEQFDQTFQFQAPKKFRLNFQRHCHCLQSLSSCFTFFYSFFPILQWLPEYSWRDNLVGDFMAGLTVGVIHVPQGIAYAILTGVEPVYGLYTSFFGVLFYMVFGTSRHVSIGSFAIISLMTGVSCRNIQMSIHKEYLEAEIHYLDTIVGRNFLQSHSSLSFQNFTSELPRLEFDYSEIVQAITFTSGLIQIFMAVLRVEFLASYLSDQLVSGFCTGAAVHVVVVQLSKLLQINSSRFSGPGYLIKQVHQIFLNLPQTNYLALTISLTAFVFLYVGKDFINPKLRKKLPSPIPFELILVVASTAISSLVSFESNHNVTVVREVPLGLPVAKPPRLDLLPYVFGDALEIAFLVVALHLSMCKVFNRKMGTKTDNNMELYALGLMGSLSSFFNTYPISSSIGRSMLNVECGAKTQLSAFFTAILLLIVILFLGPLLSDLPMCVLAVIIIYSMKSIFQKMPYELFHLWRVSKIDFMIWVVTFVATVVLNVMQGLAVAVAFALLTTVFRIQWPRWHLLSRLNGTEDYRDCGRYSHVTDVDSVRIFRFDAPLLFTNAEHFANSARRAVTTMDLNCLSNNYDASLKNLQENSKVSLSLPNTNNNKQKASQVSASSFMAKRLSMFTSPKNGMVHKNFGGTLAACVEHLVVDCSGFTFVDYSSVNALIDLFHQLRQNHVNVYFAGAKAPIRDMLEQCGFYKSVGKKHFYPTIHDAVLAAIDKKRLYVRKRGVSEPMQWRNNNNKKSTTTFKLEQNSSEVEENSEILEAVDVMTSTTDIPQRPASPSLSRWTMGSINRVNSKRLDELDDV